MTEPSARALRFERDIWKETSRHLDIGESVAHVAKLLREHLPLSGIALRTFDLARSRVETIATDGKISSALVGTTELAQNEISAAIHAFSNEPSALLEPASMSKRARLGFHVIEDARESKLFVSVLRDEATTQGFALFSMLRSLDRAEKRLLGAAVAPLALALANDRRMHEMARLREATEAENRALLSRLHRENIVETVIGERDGLREVMERVSQVARTDVPVLLLGETGSGKEVIARAIHERSARSKGPMVRVNCGAIPSELIDSELFGHERGSFTGAVAMRKGWFERADGGTLLLDEIGELPLAAQVRLLRILQEGTLERVGAHSTTHVNVRIVAATHRDLRAMVEAETFREDLWYRLSVFPIRLPPLRERPEDVPKLAAHFAARSGERLGGAPLVPSSRDIALMLAYDWPGNVRELAAVVERAAILGHGKKLEMIHALGGGALANRGRASSNEPSQPDKPVKEAEPEDFNLDRALRLHIERALTRTFGRIEGRYGAARLLGINPHTLRARMRKLKIDWRKYRAND